MTVRILPIVLLLIAFESRSQPDLVVARAQQNLDAYNLHYKPEYVDVTIDKDFYFTGEKIWYALYVSNVDHASNTASAVVYVEIRDALDSVLIRQKVKCNAGTGHGEITLPEQLPTGKFKLVAFTLWMKNTGSQTLFETWIPVINPRSSAHMRSTEKRENDLTIFHGDSGTLVVDLHGMVGELLAYTRSSVFFHQTVSSTGPIVLKDIPADRHVFIALLDQRALLIDGAHVLMNPRNTMRLSTSPATGKPRSKEEVTIEIGSDRGVPFEGRFSVSVRPKNPLRVPDAKVIRLTDARPLISSPEAPLTYDKEMFIYPASRTTLRPLSFAGTTTVVPATFEPNEEAIYLAELKNKIAKAYEIYPMYEAEVDYHFHFNNSYQPDKYASLSSLDEFIREIVPQVKVRKVRGQKEPFVRNSDNPGHIYFYKKPALILLDGMVVKANDLFAIPLEDVESLDVMWGTAEINLTDIFAMADNGVLAIRTKSRRPVATSQFELFREFHVPIRFTGPSIGPNDPSPKLMDPIYWNPALVVLGKTRISFDMSDDLGEMIVEVKGYTRTGEYVTGETVINVVAGSN